jgi:antitoxin component YwqK of YwqJK toxin-antitoxin module
MMKKLLLIITAFSLAINLLAQVDYDKQMPAKVVLDHTLIDSVYGIQHYEPLNVMLSGDSVRMCGTYACQNQVKDYYVTGELLHSGFYVDGQLKSYKNYYPNGNVERDFRAIDLYRSQVKKYYESGQLKSQVKFVEGAVQEWTDFYANGQKEMEEERTKDCTYHIFARFYYEDGKPMKSLELADKKKTTYTYKEFYKSGAVKLEGSKIYKEELGDYINTGVWKYFDESGSVTKEEKFDNGTLVKN